jgi:hypothetical protein
MELRQRTSALAFETTFESRHIFYPTCGPRSKSIESWLTKWLDLDSGSIRIRIPVSKLVNPRDVGKIGFSSLGKKVKGILVVDIMANNNKDSSRFYHSAAQ